MYTSYLLSETHYSLKEMETSFVNVIKPHCDLYVRNPLLSERDGNGGSKSSKTTNVKNQSETHYSLKEMETWDC